MYDELPRTSWIFKYSAQTTVVVSRTFFTQASDTCTCLLDNLRAHHVHDACASCALCAVSHRSFSRLCLGGAISSARNATNSIRIMSL